MRMKGNNKNLSFSQRRLSSIGLSGISVPDSTLVLTRFKIKQGYGFQALELGPQPF